MTTPEERACMEYLSEHADFFTRHPGLLKNMDFTHGTDLVPSLLDKRMELLQKSNAELERKTRNLLARANHNEDLSLRVYKLGRELIRRGRTGKPHTPATCCDLVRKHFPDLDADILLFGEAGSAERTIRPDDQRIEGLVESLFTRRQLSCGPFNAAEKVALFGKRAMQAASALAAPLGGYKGEGRYGLLVLTSSDVEKFMPGLGTMFLVQLVGIIEAALGVDCGDP